jgi:hypothetical protein
MENAKQHCTKVANWLAVEFTVLNAITNRMEMELVLRRRQMSMIVFAPMTAIVDRTCPYIHTVLICEL